MITVRNLYNNLRLSYNVFSKTFDIANPLFQITNDEQILSWHKYLPKESFNTYEEYFEWVNSNLQYSLAISDVGFIQIFYKSENDKIVKASLAFLPNPNMMMSFFRFDLDSINCKDYYHNTYHINFGYRSDDIRYTLNRFPYPSEFIKFILFLLGKFEFKSYNKKKFFIDLDSIPELYSHRFDFKII